ncbi:hypothetical protein LCGC14_2847650 [marine sediment metagenome]|uniref:Uncharacterized protein n=1 Tax=marine sediment metagenome TaxID=412755 RepID=A0A0F8Y9F4_9ZZZZ
MDVKTSETYNGWKNYETWNIALWINNDEGLHDFAKGFSSYDDFKDTLKDLGTITTPDNIAFDDSRLDIDALDNMIFELNE